MCERNCLGVRKVEQAERQRNRKVFDFIMHEQPEKVILNVVSLINTKAQILTGVKKRQENKSNWLRCWFCPCQIA